MNTTEYSKLYSINRYWLLGKAESDSRYYITVRAFEFALEYHNGVRRDGVTKEFYHQLSIFSALRTMTAMMISPHIVLAVALLHDTYEDYPESHQRITKEFSEIEPYLIRISKVRGGEKIKYKQYFGEMSQCSVTSLVKIFDRIHNLSTMQGVFSENKQKQYVDDVYNYFLPMIKVARRMFPEEEPCFEMGKNMLMLITKSVQHNLNYNCSPP